MVQVLCGGWWVVGGRWFTVWQRQGMTDLFLIFVDFSIFHLILGV